MSYNQYYGRIKRDPDEVPPFPWKWAILAIAVMFSIGFVTNIIGVYNLGNKFENQVKAEYTNLSNVLGQYTLKVAEAAQVPDMYRDDMKEVITAAISARYGGEGSKATFQWLREHNATLDVSVYAKIQQIIEAGRNEYTNTQTRFIDIKRQYETVLGSLWTGFLLRAFGYPVKPLEEYKIVSSDAALEALEKGKQEPVLLRKSN